MDATPQEEINMALLDTVDPQGLEEFSVVFTDRSLNHMSARFQQVMRDISGMLSEVYNASAVAIVPGGGTYGMEAVARQFGRDAHALIVRNGWFSYRCSQISKQGISPRKPRCSRRGRTATGCKRPLPRRRLPRSQPPFATPNPMWYLRRMWKHPPV